MLLVASVLLVVRLAAVLLIAKSLSAAADVAYTRMVSITARILNSLNAHMLAVTCTHIGALLFVS